MVIGLNNRVSIMLMKSEYEFTHASNVMQATLLNHASNGNNTPQIHKLSVL